MNTAQEPGSGLPEFRRWLAGSERPRPTSHIHLGGLGPDEVVVLTIVLRRKPDSPPLPPVPLENRAFLSKQDYAATYGADPLEVEAAAAFLEAEGMRIVEAHPGRRLITIRTTAAQVRAVFGVSLERYQDTSAMETLPLGTGQVRTHRGFDGAVSLPAELARCVTAVVGLDDRFVGAPRGDAVAEPAGVNSPTVSSVAQKLRIPNTGAYGEVIGILAAQPPGSPGTGPCYLASDITDLYFAHQPAGYRTRPMTLFDVNLTVGTKTYQNNPSQVTRVSSLAEADVATLELTQEIAAAATVAQGARVNVYFTEASEQGLFLFLNRVLLPERELQPTALSFSLMLADGVEVRQVGSHSEFGRPRGSSSLFYLLEECFRQIALLGISVFIAVGNRSNGKWKLLAAPNLAPPAQFPRPNARLGEMVENSDRMATAFSMASLEDAVPAADPADPAGRAHRGIGISEIGSQAAYSGFFVNGIGFSYAGPSCVASFNVGTTALLRRAFGVGLGCLYSMLDQLRRTQASSHRSQPESDSETVSPGAEGEIDPADGEPSDAKCFITARPAPRFRIANGPRVAVSFGRLCAGWLR
jgi:Pro-kumamolisin, activation domain